MKAMTAATIMSTIGRLNSQRQVKKSTMTADIHRPRMPPAPANPAQMPMALGRSSTGNDEVMTDNVTGITMAAPTPAKVLVAIMKPVLGAMAAPKLATANTVKPVSSTGRRPHRSPMAPIGMSRAANARV